MNTILQKIVFKYKYLVKYNLMASEMPENDIC